uniref:Uncharacterized protein n=1 Tax=Rhizophora mucronata TaxID=61149 RepID=A0A2P2NLL8_RHIMU
MTTFSIYSLTLHKHVCMWLCQHASWLCIISPLCNSQLHDQEH